jgi:fibronectin type 3 domain-containing protein
MSSSGRTLGFDPKNGGSNPPVAAITEAKNPETSVFIDEEKPMSAPYVTLSWTAPAGSVVTSYNILRGTASGAETQYATSTTTTYTDNGVAQGTTYYYVVQAVNSAGTSGSSNEVSASIPFSVPGAPTGLVATVA